MPAIPDEVQDLRRRLAESDGKNLARGPEYSAIRTGRVSIRSTLPPQFCDTFGIEPGDDLESFVDYENKAVIIRPAGEFDD